MTAVSSESFSVFTSKFMRPSTLAGALWDCTREPLQLLLDERCARIVRRQLEEVLVGGDGGVGVAAEVLDLSESQQEARIVRAELAQPLVDVCFLGIGRLDRRDRGVLLLTRLLLLDVGDRALAQSLRERAARVREVLA